MIIVDTSLWSLAFRRRNPAHEFPREVKALQKLILSDAHIAVPGVVVQELLSGIREESQFTRLHSLIQGFTVLLATQQDHIQAAKIANTCRKKGVATTPIDNLIAAMAIERNALLFTLDQDFSHMTEHIPLELFQVPTPISEP